MTSKSKTKLAVAATVLIVSVILIVYAFGPAGLRLGLGPTIVTPGWEIYDQIVGAQNGNTIYTQASQFTNPNLISGPLWKFDVDAPNYGVPTMEVTVGDIHHVDFSGNDIPDSQAAETLPAITRGNTTYYLDDHIYLFTVTIRSIADVVHTSDVGVGLTVPFFQHETSWPKCFSSGSGNTGGSQYGQAFDGGAYIAFVINPWRGTQYDNYQGAGLNSSYVLSDAWAGVMNAYVLYVQQGQTANQYKDNNAPTNNNGLPTSAPEAPLSIKGAISYGDQVPMFVDDNTFSSAAPKTNFNSALSPDQRIPSSVALLLPIYIFPGAALYHDWLGNVEAIYPADGYVMYTVRVDVLQTHNFVLQTAIHPPTPKPPTDYYTWAQDWWTTTLHGLDPFAFLGQYEALAWWLVTAGVVVLVIIILIAIFAPWVLPRLASTARNTAKAAQGK